MSLQSLEPILHPQNTDLFQSYREVRTSVVCHTGHFTAVLNEENDPQCISAVCDTGPSTALLNGAKTNNSMSTSKCPWDDIYTYRLAFVCLTSLLELINLGPIYIYTLAVENPSSVLYRFQKAFFPSAIVVTCL